MLLVFVALSDIGTVKCAIFSITDDNIMEPVESFTVTGSGGNFMGEQTIQITIEDNDGMNSNKNDTGLSIDSCREEQACDSSVLLKIANKFQCVPMLLKQHLY